MVSMDSNFTKTFMSAFIDSNIDECNNTNTTKIFQSSAPSIYDHILAGLNYINIVMLPTCLLLGVTGNIITFIVMNTKSFSTLTSRYFLIALSISDTLLLLTQPLNKMIVIDIFGRDLRALSNLGCKTYFWFFKYGKMTSSWFVVYLCLERFIAVQFPLKVKTIVSKRNCIIAIVAVYLVQGIYIGVWAFAHNIRDGLCHPDAYNRSDPQEAIRFRNMLLGGCTLYSWGPMVIMLIITPMIIIKLSQHSRMRRKLTSVQRNQMKLGRVSAMLMSVVITYIVLVAPVTALHAISFFENVNAFGQNSKPFLIYRDLSQILEQLNYTINFFLYAIANPRFRESVMTLLHLPQCNCGRQNNEKSPSYLKTPIGEPSSQDSNISGNIFSTSGSSGLLISEESEVEDRFKNVLYTA